jgi:hypothetical protein
LSQFILPNGGSVQAVFRKNKRDFLLDRCLCCTIQALTQQPLAARGAGDEKDWLHSINLVAISKNQRATSAANKLLTG